MSEGPIEANSAEWTGEVPPPVEQKPARTAQLFFGLFAFTGCSIWAPAQMVKGVITGTMRVPGLKYTTVNYDHHIAFWASFGGWMIVFALSGLSAVGLARAFSKSLSRKH